MSSISFPLQPITRYPGLAGKKWGEHKRSRTGAAKPTLKPINSVGSVLKSSQTLPQKSILLGVTQDATPLFLELTTSSLLAASWYPVKQAMVRPTSCRSSPIPCSLTISGKNAGSLLLAINPGNGNPRWNGTSVKGCASPTLPGKRQKLPK